MAKSSTSFDKDKQPTKRRGKSERNKILDSFKRLSRTEDEFYDLLTEKAFNPEDQFSFKELLNRMSPIPKAVAPTYQFEFDEKGKSHEQAAQVLKAMADGLIPSDIGKEFIVAISSKLNIQEKTDFEERLKAIEDASK